MVLDGVDGVDDAGALPHVDQVSAGQSVRVHQGLGGGAIACGDAAQRVARIDDVVTVALHRWRSTAGDGQALAHVEQVHVHQVVGAGYGLGCGSVPVGNGGEVLPRLHYVYRALPLRRGGKGQCCYQEQHADHHRDE